jgi:shikimate kinase
MAKTRSNIVLIGFMGSGKTTVGRITAQRMNMPFVDLDKLIEQRAGKTISTIFAEQGEAAFRQLETEVLNDVLAGEGQLISTGGGAVLAPHNREAMLQRGVVVLLKSEIEVLLQRLQNDKTRPLLQGDARANVARILEERKDAYGFAELEVDTGRLTVEEAVKTIATFYEQQQGGLA